MRTIAAVLLVLISIGAPRCLPAVDLGVQGKVYAVTEIDMRELIVGSAANADLSKAGEALRESARRFMDARPRRSLNTTRQTQTRWLDPSFVLDQDILAPVKDARGEWEWRVLYKKGAMFNPLSVQRPNTAMLFFDGNSESEIAFVTAVRIKYPARVMLIEATGVNPEKLSVAIGAPVHSLTDPMITRFRISTTPSLLYPGEGAQQLRLGLTEFAPPFAASQAEAAWSSIRGTGPGGAQ